MTTCPSSSCQLVFLLTWLARVPVGLTWTIPLLGQVADVEPRPPPPPHHRLNLTQAAPLPVHDNSGWLGMGPSEQAIRAWPFDYMNHPHHPRPRRRHRRQHSTAGFRPGVASLGGLGAASGPGGRGAEAGVGQGGGVAGMSPLQGGSKSRPRSLTAGKMRVVGLKRKSGVDGEHGVFASYSFGTEGGGAHPADTARKTAVKPRRLCGRPPINTNAIISTEILQPASLGPRIIVTDLENDNKPGDRFIEEPSQNLATDLAAKEDGVSKAGWLGRRNGRPGGIAVDQFGKGDGRSAGTAASDGRVSARRRGLIAGRGGPRDGGRQRRSDRRDTGLGRQLEGSRDGGVSGARERSRLTPQQDSDRRFATEHGGSPAVSHSNESSFALGGASGRHPVGTINPKGTRLRPDPDDPSTWNQEPSRTAVNQAGEAGEAGEGGEASLSTVAVAAIVSTVVLVGLGVGLVAVVCAHNRALLRTPPSS